MKRAASRLGTGVSAREVMAVEVVVVERWWRCVAWCTMAESVRWAGRLGLTLGSGICAGEVALSLGPLFPTLEALGKALVSKGTAESGGRPLGRNGVTVRPERQWCTAVSRRSCAAAVALRDSRSASYRVCDLTLERC